MKPRNATAYQGARHYRWQGQQLPSVTTILQAYPRPWLGAWAAKMVAEAAVNQADIWGPVLGWTGMGHDEAIAYLKRIPWDTRNKAADFGTLLHEALADLVAGKEPSGQEAHVDALIDWWHTYRPTVTDSEVQVFSEAGYAGSLDLIAEVYGRRLLIDLKSGSVVGPEARLQMAAYRFADYIGEDDRIIAAMPHVEGCAVLWIPRDNPAGWQFIEVPAGAAEYALFMHLLAIHTFVAANKDVPLGELILPQVMA